MIPYLLYGGQELEIGIFLLVILGFLGTLLLALWVPDARPNDNESMERIRNGYQLWGCAILGFLFSSWVLAVAAFISAIYLIHIFWKGLQLIRESNKFKNK